MNARFDFRQLARRAIQLGLAVAHGLLQRGNLRFVGFQLFPQSCQLLLVLLTALGELRELFSIGCGQAIALIRQPQLALRELFQQPHRVFALGVFHLQALLHLPQLPLHGFTVFVTGAIGLLRNRQFLTLRLCLAIKRLCALVGLFARCA